MNARVIPDSVYTEVQEKKLLLKQAQPPSFNGEGPKVEQDAEVWVEAMTDYFSAAGTTPSNQSMLARFRLTGDAKLWWKQWCKDQGVSEGSQTWDNVKAAVKGRYLPPAHEAIKMNEFFALRQGTLTLEEFYSKFVTLRRYAPALTNVQQVARFCESLNEPLGSTLQAMKPTSIQDALKRAKPLSKSQPVLPVKRRFDSDFQGPDPKRHQAYPPPTPYRPHVYATNEVRPSRGNCFRCGEFGHYQQDCPRTDPNQTRTVVCFECGEPGHYRNQCPKIVGTTQMGKENQAGRGRGTQERQGGRNGNPGRGRGRGATARVSNATVEPTLEDLA